MVNKSNIINIKKHIIDKNIRSPLADTLRDDYHKRNARVIKGDTVKVLRGEYKNVEGKGEKVKVQIHSSNVMITSLNLQDKQRGNVIQKIKPSPNEKKEVKIKSNSPKTKIRRKLNIKNVLHTQPKRIAASQRSQDNKGDQ